MTKFIADKDGHWVPIEEFVRADQPKWQVMRDSPGCVSPIDGTWIEGKAARREHMRRHNVVEAGDVRPTPFRNEANRARYLGRGG